MMMTFLSKILIKFTYNYKNKQVFYIINSLEIIMIVLELLLKFCLILNILAFDGKFKSIEYCKINDTSVIEIKRCANYDQHFNVSFNVKKSIKKAYVSFINHI